MRKAVGVLLVGFMTSSVSMGSFIADPMDNDGSWTLVQGNWQTSPTGAAWPEPSAGDSFFGASWGMGAAGRIRGLYKEDIGLTTLLAGETYVVSVDFGKIAAATRPSMPWYADAGVVFGFFDPTGLDFNATDGILGADNTDDEASILAARLAMYNAIEDFQSTVVDSFAWIDQPEPVNDFEWGTWSHQFTVGSQDIEGVYFGVLAWVFDTHSGTNPGITIDNLNVIPEPATIGMFGLAGLVVLFVRRITAKKI